MNRFLLFAGGNYYPAGGWADFVGAHDTPEAATTAAQRIDAEAPVRRSEWISGAWAQVVDADSMEMVRAGRYERNRRPAWEWIDGEAARRFWV